MTNNLGNKIFLFSSLNKFTIVALNSNDEFVYKKETLITYKSNQIDSNFLDKFLSENIFKTEKELNEFVKNIFLIIDNQNIFSIHLSVKNKFDNIIRSKKRILCAPPAPPEGLYLKRIIY